MNYYTVNNDAELRALIKKILAKDKGAYLNNIPTAGYPKVIESNIKIKQ
jgi:hypothetical protein